VKKPKIHPVADLFPMMSEEELDELAEDIKANGLQFPIIVDEDGVLIDGRNRYEACRRAGVEPTFETLDGQDPVAFIISANINRRHLTKGQQAMVIAKVYSSRRDEFGAKQQIATDSSISRKTISYAFTVLQYANELADLVLAGVMPLNEAHEKALERKAEADSEEGKMARLRKGASDLADLVAEDKMKLAEGLAAMKERENQSRKKAEILRQEHAIATEHFVITLRTLSPSASDAPSQAEYILETFEPTLANLKVTKDLLAECAKVLIVLARKWKEE
jgi:ParB/RepB/Spo0J family partition protein